MFSVFDFLIAGVIFVTIVSVAGIVADYKRRKMLIEPLRAAVERGQALDPALIDKLMTPERLDPDTARRALEAYHSPSTPDGLRIGGIITASVGVACLAVALVCRNNWQGLMMPALIAGVVTLCVGGGLWLSARALERSIASRTPPRA